MSEKTAEEGNFWISLDGEFGSICAAYDCQVEATLVVTLAYCHCDSQPEDHGHPGYQGPEVDRDRALVCEKDGALIARFWLSFERLQNFTAAGMTNPEGFRSTPTTPPGLGVPGAGEVRGDG